jgi:Asp-tRNA(Asn)/Glu-tRNA(Gln) amidotransferase A subunit family amidase
LVARLSLQPPKALPILVVLLTLGAAQAAAADSGSRSDDRHGQSSFQIEEATIPEIQDALLHHRVTTTEIVKDYLDRIKAYNGTCVSQPAGILGPVTMIPDAGKLNALMTLNLRPKTRAALGFDARMGRSMTDAVDADPKLPDALETAALQDAQLARSGKLTGPLQGVVMAIKDQYDTADMRTTSGGDVQWANDRPPDDATVVARLRAAGAIILAKANLDEYAGGPARSSFGGTECNAYDTERDPGGSSGGSAVAVAANFVTCAIGEETGGSIVKPSSFNDVVGLAPTRELVSADGMIQRGIATRVGPICRTVGDAARILDAYQGFDPKDELTAYGTGRVPTAPYQADAKRPRLDGYRIGVIREYMDKNLFNAVDTESIDLADRAIQKLRDLGATIVDPGAHGALFQSCVNQYVPKWQNQQFVRQFGAQFPVDATGAPATDHIKTLLDMAFDPSTVPHTATGQPTIRNLGGSSTDVGDAKYNFNAYIRERGDAAVHDLTELIAKSTFWNDPNPMMQNRKSSLTSADKARTLATASTQQTRYTWQTVIYNCFAQMKLDAVVSPTGNVPPGILTAPEEPSLNDRGLVWDGMSAKGFPAMTIPSGFTTQVYDRGQDGTLLPPTAAKLPVGIQLLGLPFTEQKLFTIGAAYEAVTDNRIEPPGFGPLPGA